MTIATREEAQERLHALNAAIATAVVLIKSEAKTLEQFFAEAEHMASVSPILDPTLFNSSERRAAEALLTPIYKAARDLVRAYEEQQAKGLEALQRVRTAG